MTQPGLGAFFEKYLHKEPLFRNKEFLQATHTPEHILHRDEQIEYIANILAPALRMEKPSNLFIYGKTGTGKTVSMKYTLSQISSVAQKRDTPLKTIYINCKLKRVADTEYRLIAQLVQEFGRKLPATGLPTDEIYRAFYKVLDEQKTILLLVLDEIDHLVKKIGDGILYNLTRINTELQQSRITLIGISNDLVFADNLDPRVKSSLSEEELIFPPYNALELQNILKERVQAAFKPGVIGPGVIEKCAAYAAREHGDARRALELLRVAGELAERKNATLVEILHLDEAEEKIERDRLGEAIKSQPKQSQAILYAILSVHKEGGSAFFTGEAYDVYKKICPDIGLRPLTQRRVSDIIAELDMLGLINAKIISKGRYGRTREIYLPYTGQVEQSIKRNMKELLGL
ncbi:ORC1-type DNA replication protein [Candidatus Woesearchaeota archaeon]|nr:ORC1-type DNA replication protein [Candidatus Woesearchaeota archaeon]